MNMRNCGRRNIRGVLPPVNQTTVDEVATSRKHVHAVCAVLNKDIVTGMTRITEGVLKDHPVINWKDASKRIQVDKKIVRIPPRTTTQFLTCNGPFCPPHQA